MTEVVVDLEDAVAVVGMACRVPGASTVDIFWRNLLDGVVSVHRAEDGAGFGRLDGLTDFDTDLFGLPTEQAALLDPQQRLFLEVCWSALEHAGIDPMRTDACVGVYSGAAPNRYLFHLLDQLPRPRWEEALTGSSPDYLPIRAAYHLGLTGPAVATQTTCSSSLVAVCHAAQALLDYRCDVALAGGAAVVSTSQRAHRTASVSPTGRCRPFDAGADGMVFGNGAAVVVLKRLADAIDDGDQVDAVLCGWAVNNDGATRAGFAAPGQQGEAAVVAETLAAARLTATEIGMVEAHGTGTPIGDQLEVAALRQAFAASGRWQPAGCVLGSVKANLGNLDAAAGVVGLIKAVCSVRDGLLAPTPGFRIPIDELAGSPFEVISEPRKWPAEYAVRYAGVSSFGLGGTNAHVVLRQGVASPAQTGAPPPASVQLPVSAATPDALRRLAGTLADALTADPSLAVADVAHTLHVGRRRLPVRACVVARTIGDAVTGLRAVAAGVDGGASGAGEQGDLGDPPAGRRARLPGYPFQRTRCWIESEYRDG